MTSRTTIALTIAAAAITAGTALRAQQAKPALPPPPPAKHVIVTAAELKWGPSPPGLPPGAQMAVVDGDPSKAGVPFVIRAKFGDGYRVPPHWHPTDENIVVLSGSFSVGMGDKFDEGSMKALGTGGFARMPKRMHHYALAKGDTEIQVHGIGPFGITYVNPNDDPRKSSTTPSK
jgi:anti-sigma factor ChrR (cupin superfamily)